MLRTIRLYGELGKKYGKVHKMQVASVSEAVRALCANFKDFKQHIIDSDKRIAGYEVWDGKTNLSEDDKEQFHLQGNGDIKIIPRIHGAGKATKLIVGYVLVVIGYVLTAYGYGGIGIPLTQFGYSMMLSGVVDLFAKTASGGSVQSSNENTQSYIFSGALNTTKQGNPVNVGYGKMVVGSQVISASLTTADIAI